MWVCLCLCCTDREKSERLLNEGDFIFSGKLDGECSHTYLLHRQRERASKQLSNEGDLIISGKLDGECAHTNLLHRQRERASGQFIQIGRFDYQWQIGW